MWRDTRADRCLEITGGGEEREGEGCFRQERERDAHSRDDCKLRMIVSREGESERSEDTSGKDKALRESGR